MKLELEGNEDILSSILVMMSFIQKSLNTGIPINLNVCVDSSESLNIVYQEGRSKQHIIDTQLYDNVNLAKGDYKIHL